MTALMWACKNGHTSTAELLIAKRADMNMQDRVGRLDREALLSYLEHVETRWSLAISLAMRIGWQNSPGIPRDPS
jgi:ankyrin repeat protein